MLDKVKSMLSTTNLLILGALLAAAAIGFMLYSGKLSLPKAKTGGARPPAVSATS